MADIFPEIIDFMYTDNRFIFGDVTEIFGEQQTNLYRLLGIFGLAEKLRNNPKFKDESGLKEKFSKAATWHKLLSLESELYFANELTNLNFEVSFISDSSSEWRENNQDLPSPDLYVKKDNTEFFVEVTRISDDETLDQIADLIIPVIRKTKFRVFIEYSDEFSYPVVSFVERDKREKLINDFVAEFKRVIPKVKSDISTHETDIMGCKVEFTQSKRGFYAGCFKAALSNPSDSLTKPQHPDNNDKKPKPPIIERNLEAKAKKRLQWEEKTKKIPYIVALDIQQHHLHQHHFTQLLFGPKCCQKFRPPDMRHYSEHRSVTTAKKDGWENFLIDIGFDSQSDSPICEPGILITNDIISDNITGVIARIKDNVLYIPNPFAEQQINFLDWNNYFPKII